MVAVPLQIWVSMSVLPVYCGWQTSSTIWCYQNVQKWHGPISFGGFSCEFYIFINWIDVVDEKTLLCIVLPKWQKCHLQNSSTDLGDVVLSPGLLFQIFPMKMLATMWLSGDPLLPLLLVHNIALQTQSMYFLGRIPKAWWYALWTWWFSAVDPYHWSSFCWIMFTTGWIGTDVKSAVTS